MIERRGLKLELSGDDEHISPNADYLYEDADSHLRRSGDVVGNGYYDVSNAMTAARQGVIDGRRSHGYLWYLQAGIKLGWTQAHDKDRFEDAARTFASRSRDLIVPAKVAKSSVLTRP
jgi:hypothetical protein